VQDIRGSLRRQSLLVALVCVVCDGALFILRGPFGEAGWRAWVVLLAGIGVNAALAGAARYSGWVALAHAVLFAAAPLLLCTCQGYVVGNNSGQLIAGFRAGAWLRPKPAVLALGALLAGVTVGHLEGGGRVAADWRLIAINVSVSALLPWLVGRYTTARRAYIADLEREADERRQHEEEVVRRAVTEERTTIARDLHDVISHHVSAIGVHAGAAGSACPTATRRSGSPSARSNRRAGRRWPTCAACSTSCTPKPPSPSRGWTTSTNWSRPSARPACRSG